jgi:predicted transposase YdaD
MQESSVYQYIIEKGRAEGIEQGIEQGKQLGARESTIEDILLLLDTRFKTNTTQVLKPALEAIDDLQRLKNLLREAAETQSLESFISNLITNGDPA